MLLCQVMGNIVTSVQHESCKNEKIMVLQQLDKTNQPKGDFIIALDMAQSGVGDKVLLLREGNGARQVIKKIKINLSKELLERIPVKSIIIGVVDKIDRV